MKRAIFSSAMILCAASARPLWAQQNDIAVLRAEIAKQEVVIAQLLEAHRSARAAGAAATPRRCRICRTTSKRRTIRSTRCARR